MRALISVYDKAGLTDLASGLAALGWELVASGGTSAALAEAGIAHLSVEEVTGSPDMLGGRVKTLHPRIHGGILADRSKPEHLATLQAHGIEGIDLVVCNLYPFRERPGIETIDVGGPTMVRAAAKNHAHVGVVVDPTDYPGILEELGTSGALSDATRHRLARAAFAHTAAYDAAIVTWFDTGAAGTGAAGTGGAGTGGAGTGGAVLAPSIHLALERVQELRYGENPHQQGARYREVGSTGWWDSVVQHSGVALSYLNLFDAEAAWRLAHAMPEAFAGPSGRPQPAAVAVMKHANPCGAAVHPDPATACRRALAGDPVSAFGGIVALVSPVSVEVATELVGGPMLDVVVAPSYEPEALAMLIAKRKRTRILQASPPGPAGLSLRRVDAGYLVQEPDHVNLDRAAWQIPTKEVPTESGWADLRLAWLVCAATVSNAIVIVTDGQAVGVGAGQQSRVDAAEIALRKAAGRGAGGAAASDAFFPFRDGLDVVAASGVAAVIQPGGSVNDPALIAAADEHGIAMVITGERHFRH
ncbi:MAG: bifunctional phosphoribosylaminoimidazolecarboxamide formyltransferase/IMP cyclohydrolase [Acidimicrobiales bacterium]